MAFATTGSKPATQVAAASQSLAPTPLAAVQANWPSPNGNAANQNYNPQDIINSSNAQYLGINWLFPVPAHPTALLSVGGGLSVDTAPVIYNGGIYAYSQYGELWDLNATNGNVVWDYIIPLLPNSTAGQNTGSLSLHIHDGAEQFTTASFGTVISAPTIWVSAPNHVVYGLNANNGKLELNFSYYGACTPGTSTPAAWGAACGVASVSGNNPFTVYSASTSNIVIDSKTGIMITSMLSSSDNNAARCFYRGWNIDATPPTLVWQNYCSPPQPGSNLAVNPYWDISQVNNMTGAYIFYPGPQYNNGGTIPSSAAINLKTLSPSVLNSTLYNDWGYADPIAECQTVDGGRPSGATGAGWGASWILDQSTGIAYVNTGNKGPYDGPCTPGPDLWAASKMAINVTTGAWIWAFQTTAHDVWDYDCSWQQALGNETINGVLTQVMWGTCKNGYLYELNALTGAMIWAWTPPSSIMTRGPDNYLYNPMNSTQMNTEWWGTPPTAAQVAAGIDPSKYGTISLGWPNEYGGFENEFAYNPQTNEIYCASQFVPLEIEYTPNSNLTNYGDSTDGRVVVSAALTATKTDNSTIEAINATNGEMVWNHFVPTQGYRGGLSTSGNVVYATLSSGDLLMLNAQTGALIKDFYIGGPLNVLPSIGATSSGQMQVIISIDAGAISWGNGVPGDILALGLHSVATQSVTSTQSVTVTGAGTTVTSTVSGSATTVTSSATVTATVTSTSSTGVSSSALYGVAAVAVIFILVSGYLAMRGRKPAS